MNRTNWKIALLLLACTTLLPVASGAEDTMNLDGTYLLYPAKGAAYPVTTFTISGHREKTFQVTGAGDAHQKWDGKGEFENGEGQYDWRFADGTAGRTTLTRNAKGELLGKVIGSAEDLRLNWEFVAKKKKTTRGKAGARGVASDSKK